MEVIDKNGDGVKRWEWIQSWDGFTSVSVPSLSKWTSFKTTTLKWRKHGPRLDDVTLWFLKRRLEALRRHPPCWKLWFQVTFAAKGNIQRGLLGKSYNNQILSQLNHDVSNIFDDKLVLIAPKLSCADFFKKLASKLLVNILKSAVKLDDSTWAPMGVNSLLGPTSSGHLGNCSFFYYHFYFIYQFKSFNFY